MPEVVASRGFWPGLIVMGAFGLILTWGSHRVSGGDPLYALAAMPPAQYVIGAIYAVALRRRNAAARP